MSGTPTTAEWVAEDPGGSSLQTLADYGTTQFSLLQTCSTAESDCALVPVMVNQLSPMTGYDPSGTIEVAPTSVSTGVEVGAFGPGDAFNVTYSG